MPTLCKELSSHKERKGWATLILCQVERVRHPPAAIQMRDVAHPQSSTIHIELRQAQVRIEGSADPALVITYAPVQTAIGVRLRLSFQSLFHTRINLGLREILNAKMKPENGCHFSCNRPPKSNHQDRMCQSEHWQRQLSRKRRSQDQVDQR